MDGKAVRRRLPLVAALLAATIASLLAAGVVQADHRPSDTAGHSTLSQSVIGGDPSESFSFLELGPGQRYFVRDELAQPRPGRAQRRRSLLYFVQLSDFQLSDEESPARVEVPFDAPIAEVAKRAFRLTGEPEPEEESEEPDDLREDRGQGGSAAWRPQEATVAHQAELTIRQVNRFLRSPIAQGNGKHARLLNAVMTGDLADSQQRNETQWVIRLLEGGRLHPNSGSSDPRTYSPECRALVATGQLDPREARRYTGVQDYDDYVESSNFYDPDKPLGIYEQRGWPTYPGLMDRAQEPFLARGLKVPSYVAFGNHDGLVQGNEDANAVYEAFATGCVFKPFYAGGPTPNPFRLGDIFDPDYAESLLASHPEQTIAVPPDERRQYVDRVQFKRLNDTGFQADAHGFDYVDEHQLKASNGSAAYYAFTPERGIRYIVLDTVSQGGSVVFSPDQESEGSTPTVTTDAGNLDDPQWRWLKRELDRATRRDQLILIFSHHAASNMFFNIPDEGGGVPPCLGEDEHGHDVNPGCDSDPRRSAPLHFGDDLIRLLHRHPNVIAHVAGHSHAGRIQPYESENGGLWEIRTPSILEWPPESRLIEVMDNRDGTLSIFTTILDHAAPATAPPSGTPASELGLRDIASIGRALGYNDPQAGPGREGTTAPGSLGTAEDRNVELLIRDPRESGRRR